MKGVIIKYILLNCVLAVFAYLFFNLTQWNSNSIEQYGFISYLIIAVSSILVFLGVYIALKLGLNKGFIVYLYGAMFKNGILLAFCYKYKEVVRELIFFIFFIYMVLMVLEIVFILKLNKYEKTRP